MLVAGLLLGSLIGSARAEAPDARYLERIARATESIARSLERCK
jgi:hypothetical protein